MQINYFSFFILFAACAHFLFFKFAGVCNGFARLWYFCLYLEPRTKEKINHNVGRPVYPHASSLAVGCTIKVSERDMFAGTNNDQRTRFWRSGRYISNFMAIFDVFKWPSARYARSSNFHRRASKCCARLLWQLYFFYPRAFLCKCLYR